MKLEKYILLPIATLSISLHSCKQQSGQSENDSEQKALINQDTHPFSAPLKVSPDELPNTYYFTERKGVSPRDGSTASLNSPVLNWPSAENQSATFDVELSPHSDFSGDEVLRRENIGYTLYTFSKKLKPGKWHWRYATNLDGKKTWSETHHFVVSEDTTVFVPTSSDELIKHLKRPAPIVITYGKSIDEVRKYAEQFPELREETIKQADRIISKGIIRFADFDRSHLSDRNYGRFKAKQLRLLKHLAKAYILTADQKYCNNAIERINEALTWDDLNYANDMMYADFIRSLGETYDTYGDTLPKEFSDKILKKIAGFLDHQYKNWQGKVENRHLHNHFWQVEISGYFYTAVATLSALPENEKYIDHAYQLFLGRAPVAGGNGGGWANGLPYFSVNTSTLGDMAYFLQKVGGVPIFDKPWYQNLPDYYIQCGPAGAPLDGFGDMQDRVGNAGQGSLLPYLVMAKPKPEVASKAIWQLEQMAKHSNKPQANEKINFGDKVNWLMLLSNTKELSSQLKANPEDFLTSKLFPEVGVVSMHTSIADPSTSTSAYFRSSPFGAFGHMYANQNAFTLVRKAEKIFYSSGYYTSFQDPHSVTSNRHSRAHNTVLINGRGQAFGHQGYGFIKRYAHGKKITYSCGEAAKAYRPLEDKMWSNIVKSNYAKAGIDPDKDFGDGKLNSFERHIAFLRPDILVIYDVIDAKEPVTAQYLLNSSHTIHKNNDHEVKLETEKSAVKAHFYSSTPSSLSITDKDFIAPVDILQKYGKGSLKEHNHLTYGTLGKQKKIRFLNIIQLSDKGAAADNLKNSTTENGDILVGEYRISAELDTTKDPQMSITSADAELHVNAIPEKVFGDPAPSSEHPATLLSEKDGGKINHKLTSDSAPLTSE